MSADFKFPERSQARIEFPESDRDGPDGNNRIKRLSADLDPNLRELLSSTIDKSFGPFSVTIEGDILTFSGNHIKILSEPGKEPQIQAINPGKYS